MTVSDHHGGYPVIGKADPNRVVVTRQHVRETVAQVGESLGPGGDGAVKGFFIEERVTDRYTNVLRGGAACESGGSKQLSGDRQQTDVSLAPADKAFQIVAIGQSGLAQIRQLEGQKPQIPRKVCH